jgi:catechol 2,3-dioxygenase-like lactoylglutathione lyase family enzyme
MTQSEPVPANVQQVVPFFGVTDLAASLRFYRDGLGFTVTKQWPDPASPRWVWLQLGPVALMLQQFNPGRRPEGTLGLGVNTCVLCADALAIAREARARGLDSSEPFVGNGLWVVTFRDPDGYRLDFESPSDVPEETTLSQWRAQSGEQV